MLNGSCEKLAGYENPESSTKEGKGGVDVVTDADKDIQNYIISELEDKFPETGIIAEEKNESDQKESNFVIDPVDGTSNLDAGRNYYGVSIAYEEDGDTILGGIAAPTHENGLISVAVKDEGAYCETDYNFNKNLDEIMIDENRLELEPEFDGLESSLGMIEASSVRDIEDGMSELRKEIGATYIQPGSAALELVEIARGTIAFRIDTLDVWDYAAGHLILEEAGGKTFTGTYYSETLGRELDFTVAAQKGIMQEIMAVIKNEGTFPTGEKQ